MVKAVKHSTIARDLKIEYLKEHLENVKKLIAEWVMQLNAPPLLAPQKGVWGWQSVYQPFAEQDPDSNHMLKRHLRSRALWSQHASWDVKLERIWNLIQQVHIESQAKYAKLPTIKQRQYTEEYIRTALWQGFELACDAVLKIDYRIPEHQKGICFGAYNIETSVTSAEERILVEEEHRDFSDSLAGIESMKELAGLWSEVKRIQQAMYAIATKAQKSNDILYPCRFCKHLWK